MTADWLSADLPNRFAARLRDYPGDPVLSGGLLEELTLHVEGNLRIVWAPFDHLQATARLVVVGITPGRVQAENALRGFRVAMRAGMDTNQALRAAKSVGSFSGPLRSNLVAMLDHVGANAALGAASASEVFKPGSEAVHFTSSLRYAVFRSGENYNGTPDMLRTPMLREMVETLLGAEGESLQDALWLPLGPKVEAALDHLVSIGRLTSSRVLHGMPHPSGANAERIAYFLDRKPRSALSTKTNPEPIDAAREALRKQMRTIRP